MKLLQVLIASNMVNHVRLSFGFGFAQCQPLFGIAQSGGVSRASTYLEASLARYAISIQGYRHLRTMASTRYTFCPGSQVIRLLVSVGELGLRR